MKTIKNNKLFKALKKNPVWDTLFTGTPEFPMLKDPRIPIGFLDHIEVTDFGIYFHGKNSFVVVGK